MELPEVECVFDTSRSIYCLKPKGSHVGLSGDEIEEVARRCNSHRKLEQYKEYVESRINECKIPNKWLPLYFNEWDKYVSDLAKELDQALKEAKKE